MNESISAYAVFLYMSVFTVMSSFAWVQTAFDKALRNGAEARVVVSVVDDDGRPVSNATVKAFFEMGLSDGSRSCEKETDGKGIAVLEGKVSRSIHFRVEKVGHYKSHKKICLIEMGHEYEVRNDKWQPWGIRCDVVLRRIKHPVASRGVSCDWRRTKALNEWVGFDVEKYDFVKPHGIGEVNDFDVFVSWDGLYNVREYTGIALKIRFSGRFAGGYYVPKYSNSEYGGPYMALTNQTYMANFEFAERPVRDKRGLVVRLEGTRFDASKVLVCRSRCKVSDDGVLRECRYFQISDLEFSCSRDEKAALSFNVIYNPTPNDTNLEPRREGRR